MNDNNKNRFKSKSMAEMYDKICKFIVPGYEFMQDYLMDMLKFERIDKPVFLDLGAGSGILIERILKTFPNSKCYYLDSSEDFTSIAKDKLIDYGDRVTFINSDFSENWESNIQENIDVITSSNAIHHLLNEDKRTLYEKCYNLLDDDGWFFNIDEMKTVKEETYIRSLEYWVYYAEKQKEIVPDNMVGEYYVGLDKFEDWKRRNLDNISIPKGEGDDIHESFLKQLKWLEDIGFTNVDIFCKLSLWCMIGGKKSRNKNITQSK